MQGEEERSPIPEIWSHVGLSRIQESVADQDEVGLKMLDLEPCVAEQYFFESIDLVVRNVDREFRPIEDIPEWVMCLITEKNRYTAATSLAS